MDRLTSLVPGVFGRNIICLETVDSTNTLASDLGSGGAIHGTVVIADSQVKGRGRLGRSWISPPRRSIALSILLRPPLKPGDATLLTVLSAVACCRALRSSTTLQVSIKWPNDLVIDDRKIGGILTEVKTEGRKILFAVIGIGINVNSDSGDFPPDLRNIVTSLKAETGRECPRTLITAAILNEIEYWYDILISGGRNSLLREWRTLCSSLGREVIVTIDREIFAGIAEGIDDRGMLLLRISEGTIKTIHSGDVTMLRKSGRTQE